MFSRIERRLRQAGNSWETIASEMAYPEELTGLDAAAQARAEAQVNRLQAEHRQRFTHAMQRFFGVDVRLFSELGVGQMMEQRIAENARLIKTIPARFHDDLILDIRRIQQATPFDQQALRQLLENNYKSSGWNVRRITRDQTSKTISDLNQIRQTNVGIESYQWFTSQDERVRPTHAANSMRVFRWNSPPAATGHPGHDVLCRCIAAPVVPGIPPLAEELNTEGAFSLL